MGIGTYYRRSNVPYGLCGTQLHALVISAQSQRKELTQCSACINEWKLVNFFTLTKRSTSAMHAIRVCPARNSKHVYKLYTVSKPK